MTDARHGWQSNFATFSGTPVRVIRGQLQSFIQNASKEQVRAWDDSIPPLQREVTERFNPTDTPHAPEAWRQRQPDDTMTAAGRGLSATWSID